MPRPRGVPPTRCSGSSPRRTRCEPPPRGAANGSACPAPEAVRRAGRRPAGPHEWDWARDLLTSVPGDEQPPLLVPLQGHALLRKPPWAGARHWAGAETPTIEWGRLEGTVESCRHAAAQVLRQLAGGA